MKKLKRLIPQVIFISIISLILLEVALRFIISPYVKTQTYNRRISIDTPVESPVWDKRHDDLYEKYDHNSSNTEILAIGDSFTNGGNVELKDSYPKKLFTELKGEYTVKNMGLCEDTSKGTLFRIKHHLNDSQKRKIFIVLTGAADIFFKQKVDFENFYRKTYKDEPVPFFEVRSKITQKESTKSFHFLFPRVFKVIFLKSKDLFNSFSNKDQSLGENFEHCFKNSAKESCLEKFYKVNSSIFTGDNSVKKSKGVLNSIIYYNQRFSKNPELDIVMDIIQYIKLYPKNLVLLDFTYNLISYSMQQTKIELIDIVDLLEGLYKSDIDYFDKRKIDDIESLGAIIKALKNLAINQNTIFKERREYLEEIAALDNGKDLRIIFSTYPLKYHVLNKQILEVAKKFNLKIVDLEKKFNTLYKNGYKEEDLIGDWEHCTPLGYSIMSKEISKAVLEIVK